MYGIRIVLFSRPLMTCAVGYQCALVLICQCTVMWIITAGSSTVKQILSFLWIWCSLAAKPQWRQTWRSLWCSWAGSMATGESNCHASMNGLYIAAPRVVLRLEPRVGSWALLWSVEGGQLSEKVGHELELTVVLLTVFHGKRISAQTVQRTSFGY